MFNCLILGDPIAALQTLHEGQFENVAQDAISQWQKEYLIQEDEITLSLDVPVVNTANYDDLIPMADGIIYFLNPNSAEEIEIFRELMKIIQGVRRDIPTIIIFHDKTQLIRFPINSLFEWIWEEYFFEAWIMDYASKNKINEIMKTLILALMRGEQIINYDLSWIQQPFLVRKANDAIISENWEFAAKYTQKNALISKNLEQQDWTIYAEQAAWLFAQNKDFLSAAKIIRDFNSVYAQRYRKLYVDNLIAEGRRQNNEKQFLQAAKTFEMAGNWARIELNDEELMKKAYQYSIYAYISSIEFAKAFTLLEKFNHDEMIEILTNLTDKILGAADFLKSRNELSLAKEKLYICFQRYQKLGLFEDIKKLGQKEVEVLKAIVLADLNQKDPNAAKDTIEEIINIWESFDIEPENLDEFLFKVGQLFITNHDFQNLDSVFTQMESSELKSELTQARMDEEELIKAETKKDELSELGDLGKDLLEYGKEDGMIYFKLNQNLFNQADRLIMDKKFEKAADLILNQSHWLKQIGKVRLYQDVLEHALLIQIKGLLIAEFLNSISSLPEERKKQFLKNNIDQIQTGFKEFKDRTTAQQFEQEIIKIIQFYRNHLLYEESRLFSEMLIDRLIAHGSEIASKKNVQAILEAIDLTHKIETIANSYLDDTVKNLDPIYSIIVSFYIDEGNHKEARAYSDKLIDKEIAAEYYKRMEDIEGKVSSAIAQQAHDKQQMKIYADQLSQLMNLARDQKIAQDNLMRMRKGLKKHYFQAAIDKVSENDPMSAAEMYFDVAKKLSISKKFELAGVSTAVGTLIYIMLRKISRLTEEIEKLEQDLGQFTTFFHETFPIKVVDYIINMINAQKPDKIRAALKLFEIFALFPEEKLFLETLLGGKVNLEEIISTSQDNKGQVTLPSNYSILIERLSQDPRALSKRRVIEMKYWGEAQDHFARQEYQDASNRYLDVVVELYNRNMNDNGEISILMGYMSLLKMKSAEEVLREFEKYSFRMEKEYPNLINSDVVQLLEIFLRYFEIDSPQAKDMILQIGEAFQQKLPLFDWEVALIKNIIRPLAKEEAEALSPTEMTNIPISINDEENALLNDQMIVLTQEINAIAGELQELKEKRMTLRESYYSDIIQDFGNENWLAAAEKYLKLAKRTARRKGFLEAGLMILLNSLSLLKANNPTTKVSLEINSTLNSLGIVKNILEESIGIKVARFLIDAIESESESIKIHLVNILNLLPLLEEEQVINIFRK